MKEHKVKRAKWFRHLSKRYVVGATGRDRGTGTLRDTEGGDGQCNECTGGLQQQRSPSTTGEARGTELVAIAMEAGNEAHATRRSTGW